jgi:hypothetical protein
MKIEIKSHHNDIAHKFENQEGELGELLFTMKNNSDQFTTVK